MSSKVNGPALFDIIHCMRSIRRLQPDRVPRASIDLFSEVSHLQCWGNGSP